MNVASCLFGTNQVVIKQSPTRAWTTSRRCSCGSPSRGASGAVHLPGREGEQQQGAAAGATHLGTILAVGYFLQIIGLEGTTSAKARSRARSRCSAGIRGAGGPARAVVHLAGVRRGDGGRRVVDRRDGSPFVAGDAVCILSTIIFGYHTLASSKYARLFEDQELSSSRSRSAWWRRRAGCGSWARWGTGASVRTPRTVSRSTRTRTSTSPPSSRIPPTSPRTPAVAALLWMGLATTSFSCGSSFWR